MHVTKKRGLLTVAIIPARGGSKGIPHKNLRMLGGTTLIARTILAAQAAHRISGVFVSTDDPAIAAEATRHGASALLRPASLAGDDISSEAVLLHAMGEIEQSMGSRPDILVFLQCTSPMTTPEDIDGAIHTLLKEKADSLLTVAPQHRFLWRRERDGAAGINHDERQRLPRQKLPPQYVETGAIYAMRWTGFKKARHRFFGIIGLYVVPASRSLEIDDPLDLEIADALIRAEQSSRQAALLPKAPKALILDFDGVFTDNRVLVRQDGFESVHCHRGDGLGLARLNRSGLPILVLSTEANPVVRARCRKLRIECIASAHDKLPILRDWLKARKIPAPAVIYLGNDINDLDCMKSVGCPVAVADAEPETRCAARIVLTRSGGAGAIRELSDLILQRLNDRASKSTKGST